MPADRLLPVILIAVLAVVAVVAARARVAARLAAWGSSATLAGMLLVRWTRSGHPPVFGTFEMDLAETLCLLLLGLALTRDAGGLSLRVPAIVGSLTLLHTFLLRTGITPLTISERSLWIDLHAILAWLAWGLYLHAVFHAFGGPALEGRGLRLLGWGFLAQSAMGFVGVYYGTLLFATPWSWDPVQTLGLLSWILFGVALHFRLFFGVTLHRQRHFLLLVVLVYVVSGKLIMFLRPGQSFHVFELGGLAGAERR